VCSVKKEFKLTWINNIHDKHAIQATKYILTQKCYLYKNLTCHKTSGHAAEHKKRVILIPTNH